MNPRQLRVHLTLYIGLSVFALLAWLVVLLPPSVISSLGVPAVLAADAITALVVAFGLASAVVALRTAN